MTAVKVVGSRLKAARRKAKLTQGELGKAVGLSRITISKMENGKPTKDITLNEIIDFMRILNVRGWWLVGLLDDSSIIGELNEAEKSLIAAYRGAPEARKTAILAYAMEPSTRAKLALIKG